MGSIEVDGVLISIGRTFKCPMCQQFKKTKEFIDRISNGEFKSSDIICDMCFKEKMKKKVPWKWIHTTSCPNVKEYGGSNNLRKYCVECLEHVLWSSSTDWYKYSYVECKIRYEKCKIRSLQQLCIKQIVEKNIQFIQLPDKLKNHIQEFKK